MQAISRFVRTTIFGGVLFLTPIVVIWLILSKAYNLAGRVLLPLTALIPESLSTRTTITAVLEVLLIALACFLAGLFARTMRAQRIVRELEVSVLSKVPGYEYMKQAGASMLGVGETADYPVILANLGGAWRIGVQTDVLGEESRRRVRPQFAEPAVGRSVPHRRRPRASRWRLPRRCDGGSQTLRHWIGNAVQRTRSGRADINRTFMKSIQFRLDLRIDERPLAVGVACRTSSRLSHASL